MAPHSSKPRRPLTSYNIFFQEERYRMLREIDQDPDAHRPEFKDLARSIAKRWKAVTPGEKAYYDQLALVEKQKYVAKLIEWHDSQQTTMVVEEKAVQESERNNGLSILVDVARPLESITDPGMADDSFSPSIFDEVPTLPYEDERSFRVKNVAVPNDINHGGTILGECISLTYGHSMSWTSEQNTLHEMVCPHFLRKEERHIPGSTAWIAEQLGSDGIRFLVDCFAEDA